jgi:hypothetical protein
MSDSKSIISLVQLKNEFFYTFGITPLDAYNVIGDAITDNTEAIQKAINDAVTNGIKYIFVTKGIYYCSKDLEDKDKVSFIGNAVEAVITGVEIQQFPDMWVEGLAKFDELLPIGSIIEIGYWQEIPENYLICNGSTVNVEDYKELYKSLNIQYSSFTGDTVNGETIVEEEPTTFKLPKLDGESFVTKKIIRYK